MDFELIKINLNLGSLFCLVQDGTAVLRLFVYFTGPQRDLSQDNHLDMSSCVITKSLIFRLLILLYVCVCVCSYPMSCIVRATVCISHFDIFAHDFKSLFEG